MTIISDDCDDNNVGVDAYGSSHIGGGGSDDDEEDGDDDA